MRGKVRPIGLAAMGMPCQLYGTGMAFPWPLLEQLSLASGNIVEDMKLTVDLIERGTLPLFCSDATVVSAFPAAADAADAQRKRWEHGHLATMFNYGIPAVARARFSTAIRKLMLALDICVPPLSLLVMLLAALTVASALAAPIVEAACYTALVCLAAWFALCTGIAMAWRTFGRGAIDVKTLWRIPGYAASKLPLYFKFLTGRQREWNRTERK